MAKLADGLQGRVTRRGFVTQVGALGIGAAATAILAGCGGSSSKSGGNSDQTIINAAATAEALATVMYDNIIKTSPAYQTLTGNTNDQAYLVAGREQEFLHYQTLTSAGAAPLALTFYFPTGMFSDATYVTTINTLITLEDTFIAAYLIGVRDLSTTGLKVLAAQIAGIEAEHRALGRVIASDLGLTSTTGQSGVAESVVSPGHAVNNIAYERMFPSKFHTISDIVTALGSFVTPGTSGFSATPYAFNTAAGAYYPGSPNVMLDSTSSTA